MAKYNPAHRGRVIETATSQSGTMYRIYDDGNCCTFHLFFIERLQMYGKMRVWQPTDKKTYCDYMDARKQLQNLIAA